MDWHWLAATDALPVANGIAIGVPLVAIAWWESCRPERTPDQGTGQRWLANFSLYAINTGVWLGLAPLIGAATQPFAFKVSLLPEAPALRFLALLLAFDLAEYVLHRLLHRFGWLWRLHAVHHSDTDLDVSSTVRHHPFEGLGVSFALVITAGLLGAAPYELAAYGVFGMAVQLLAHANLAIPPRISSVVGWLIVTPAFHRLHHCRDERFYNANFGEVFTIWDRLFGTLAAPSSAAPAPAEFGVTAYLAPRFSALGWILLQPFLSRPA